jgi:hypothetical protein
MIRRHTFTVNVALAGGTRTDTGPGVMGQIVQMEWAPDNGDTGQPATIQLTKFPKQGDTGHGRLFYTSGAGVNLGAPLRAQNPLIASGAGADTGQTFIERVVCANERVQLKIVPADTGVNRTGNLYLYSRED